MSADSSAVHTLPYKTDKHRTTPQLQNAGGECFRCGKCGHVVTNCWFKTAKCYQCEHAGHLCAVLLKTVDNSAPKQKKENVNC